MATFQLKRGHISVKMYSYFYLNVFMSFDNGYIIVKMRIYRLTVE